MTQREAVELVRRAISNPGRVPSWHYAIMRKHRKEWPTLWNALDELLRSKP